MSWLSWSFSWTRAIELLVLPPSGFVFFGLVGLLLIRTRWRRLGLALAACCALFFYLSSTPWIGDESPLPSLRDQGRIGGELRFRQGAACLALHDRAERVQPSVRIVLLGAHASCAAASPRPASLRTRCCPKMAAPRRE